MKDKAQALDTLKAFESGQDMSQKEHEVLTEIVEATAFIPQEAIWRSSYWGTNQIGAVHYKGKYNGQTSVLKIQGVKPEISEIFMIEEFTKQNRSKIIKPPLMLTSIPWNDEKGYEAFIAEFAEGEKVLKDGQLVDLVQIQRFFELYREYRDNCLPRIPWLPVPTSVDFEEGMKRLVQLALKAYPDHPFREKSDFELVQSAAELLDQLYERVPLEFIHGHLSANDLVYKSKGNREVILFSNLFWKWKHPFYDAIFAYHWFMFSLAKVDGITPEQVEEQRQLWFTQMDNLLITSSSIAQEKRLLKAALLERAAAGLLIDSFLVDKEKPIARYLTESTRQEVIRLTQEISNVK